MVKREFESTTKLQKKIVRWREEHAPKHCVKVPTDTRSLCFNNVLMETIAGSNPVLTTYCGLV